MEDRRITKTKRSLKTALIDMLAKEDFEHISITELCRRADVSRITFYSHYNDKYALLDDIFEDMLRIGTEDYYRRQREYNPTGKLDGAFGKENNIPVFKRIIRDAGVPAQVGGGIRSAETIDDLISAGADRVVVGTKAVKESRSGWRRWPTGTPGGSSWDWTPRPGASPSRDGRSPRR